MRTSSITSSLKAEEKKNVREPLIAFKDKLNPLEIITLYPETKKDQKLYNNLYQSYLAINKIREMIDYCVTHPSFNTVDKQSRRKIEAQLRRIRDDIADEIEFDYEEEDQAVCEITVVANYIAKYRIANCEEISIIILKIFIENYFENKIQAEIFKCEDHIFVVVGRVEGSNPSDCKTWGPHAVVCDGWGGYAFPAAQIPSKLQLYFDNQAEDLNMAIPFVPEKHSLKKLTRIASVEEYIQHYDKEISGEESYKEDTLISTTGFFSGEDSIAPTDQISNHKKSSLKRKYTQLKAHDHSNIKSLYLANYK